MTSIDSARSSDQRSRSRRPGRSLLALSAAAAVALGACSSDGSSAPEATDPPESVATSEAEPPPTESVTTESVTEPDPTTTSTTKATPASTESPTATDSPAPTSTESSTPDSAPGEDLTGQLIAALDAHTQAWVTCVSQAPACDVTALADTRAGDQLASSIDIVTGVNTNGWTISNLESYRTEVESVEIRDAAAEALVTTCNEDGLVVSKDGEIVNDRFSSRRTLWTFESFDGVWKATTGVELESAVGKDDSLCSF